MTATGVMRFTAVAATLITFLLISWRHCLPTEAKLPRQPVKASVCQIATPRLSVADIIRQNVKTGQAKDVRPLGVPTWWDWYDGANRPLGRPLALGYTENVGYGIIHERVGSQQPNHALASLGPMQVWLYGSDQVWRKVKDGPLTGAAYRTDFKHNASKPWQVTVSQQGQVLTGEPEPDWNLHFWNAGPRGIAREDDKYVYVRYYAKASHPGALVACAGDDQYQGSQQNAFAQSNHVLLTRQWQSIVYTNAPWAVLEKLPLTAR